MIFLIENYELSEKTPRVKKFLKLLKECNQIFSTAFEKKNLILQLAKFLQNWKMIQITPK